MLTPYGQRKAEAELIAAPRDLRGRRFAWNSRLASRFGTARPRPQQIRTMNGFFPSCWSALWYFDKRAPTDNLGRLHFYPFFVSPLSRNYAEHFFFILFFFIPKTKLQRNSPSVCLSILSSLMAHAAAAAAACRQTDRQARSHLPHRKMAPCWKMTGTPSPGQWVVCLKKDKW